MKAEPTLGRNVLVETLFREYGLSVDRLDFWPSDWTSYCYVVHASNGASAGERYFLKLTPENYTLTIASDPAFYLPLTYQLHTRGILPYIAYPLPTGDGRFIRVADGYRQILFNYIEGETVGFGEWPAGLETRLAGLLGRLHRSAAEIQLDHVMEERFAFIFENDLLLNLKGLEQLTAADRPGKLALRDLLLPRQDELRGLLARAHELQAYAVAAMKPKVFCHTDLHGGNLMLDAENHLYIIDWEGALLAPPEQDLFFFAWRDEFWETFLPAYEAEFGPARLDSKIFGFYYYRRNLEDLADWVNRIMSRNTTAEQDAEDLHGVREDCLSSWPYLEKNIRKIEAHLLMRKSL